MARFLTLIVLLTGCHYTLTEPGTEPLTSQFYFPSGMVLDPGGRYLYVSNANADLRYGGGTVQVVDLFRFDCAYRRARGLPVDDPAMCLQPAWSSDIVLCTTDPLDPSVTECDETPFIIGAATVKVGNFAGDLKLVTTGVYTRRLFVAVRGDPSITWIDVDLTQPGFGLLSCFDHPSTKLTAGITPGCDASHLVQGFVQTQNCSGVGPTDVGCPSQIVGLPPEPFGLQLDEGLHADGSPYRRLLSAHLAGGQITILNVLGVPFIESVSSAFFAADTAARHGAFGLAPQHPGQNRSLWYLTSNLQSTVATFRIADTEVVTPQSSFALQGPFQSGSDVRTIGFAPDGNRAFVAVNSPPSLALLDTRPSDLSGDNPLNRVVDIVDVCQTPSHLTTIDELGAGAPGQPALHQTRVFVVCFLSNQVMIVDPDRAQVLDTVLVGRGPNELVYHQNSNFSPSRRAYVSAFGDGTLGVVDLDDGSPTHNRVVARIGLPTPPPPP